MLINYAPGEECRVAVAEDGKLEDLHTERANAVSHVGNIYVGKVVNVEAGIQAAFVDFGLEHNAFLHISDLHPQYFPGQDDETTESVGKKIPRRERPPIQRALKRGQEIVVQVIKEGVGTKGPTVTSYLSVPGRFLVMMPGMDRVGVSRKIEDDEQRRAMRQVLDQLALPEGFGFILRTAGMDQTKTELKRDLAYLNRLWRDMERRRKTGKGPRLLYAESDLLLRSLRDMVTPDIDEIVIDHESALRRASRFLKIFAPRSAPTLLHYDGPAPIFHAYGIEGQISAMNARRVPLRSGGSLVIDEAEALVAIDVNSGKTRGSGDAESTAFKTNREAIDEICRQMKLRDLGGIVVLDLIDMRSRANRRDIEQRLRANLKKDAARSKALPISQFGMIELTRQRMRGSHRNVHFAPCPDCEGRGFVQRPDSVASDAMRSLGALLTHESVRKVEVVVSPRVAGEMLSSKRRAMNRLELHTGKAVAVRVSESVPVDHVAFYAYDDRGADVDIERLPRLTLATTPKPWVGDGSVASEALIDTLEEERRALERADVEPDVDAEPVVDESEPMLDLAEGLDESAHGAGAGRKKKRRRRRRGRGRAGAARDAESAEASAPAQAPASAPTDAPAHDDRADATAAAEGSATGKKKRRRRRRRRSNASAERADQDQAQTDRVEPDGDQAERTPPPTVNGRAAAPAAEGSRFAPRGDSWDLDPAELAPTPKPKRRRRKKDSAHNDAPTPNSREAQAEVAPAPPAEPAAESPASPIAAADASEAAPATKKKRSRSAKAPAKKKKPARKKKTATTSKKKAARKKTARKPAPPEAPAPEPAPTAAQ